jgi:hypothetical protein
MFSTDGLSHGEIVVVSGLFAMGMLMIASVIGVIVALVATREPRVETTAVRASAPARGDTRPVAPHGTAMIPG